MRRTLLRLGLASIGFSLVVAALTAPTAAAQLDTTFVVTVENKTSAHPDSDRGWPEGFVIDGEQGRSIAVERGKTYVFQLNNVPAIHPFYISTSAEGQGAGVYSDGVTGNFATGNDQVVFSPGENTPDLLYYQCASHQFMGWRIYVTDAATVAFQTVATGLTAPVTMAQPDDGSGRLFIADQAGWVRVISADGTLLEEPFLDVTDRMVSLREGFDERGLLGLAFHPDYANNGRFFVYYSAPLRDGAPSGWDHTATISEFQVSSTDPDVADPESERILLEVDQPQFNHDGGTLLFGPDHYLYISLGDGGAADDNAEGHVEDWYAANAGGNAQAVDEGLLGNILRIDVDTGEPYGIPADNPFVGRDGMDEIYAYGLRNPYRMSWDMGGEHGLLVGDAGQNRWEEVSRVSLGDNLGWNVKEGVHCFSTANPDGDAATCPDEVGAGHPDEGAPLVDPVIEYQNLNQEDGVGLVVVGGAVYRGTAIPELAGKYVFGDWSKSFGAPEGLLFVATPQSEGRWPMQNLYVAEREDGRLHHFLLGIGQDLQGEVYVLASDSTAPTGTSGVVYRMISPEDVASEDDGELPQRITLHQNYPNPFNPSTSIRFSTPIVGPVKLTIYDALGREVATLVDGTLGAGDHEVTWNGLDDGGTAVPSGTYVYRIRAAAETDSRVMTLVR